MADFALSAAETDRIARPPAARAVSLWLWSVAALVFLMVVVGGATRLTESGLSITEWKPITGVLPPLSDAAWQAEFAKYKQIPQYSELFPTMTVGEFKFIFFWEWTHRLIGRLLGLAFAGPLALFWLRGMLPQGLKPKLVGVLALGGLQGVVGWWMVTSGLSGRIEVAQERLATHLVLASITFAALVWLAAAVWPRAPRRTLPAYPGLRTLATILLGVTLLQIGLGGLVAGLRAGLTYNSWPLMDGHFVPPTADLALLSPLWRNLVDNVTTVQFDHRMTAYLLLALALFQAFVARSRGGWTFAAIVAAQAGLGILTLVLVVPLPAALLHQAFAMVVLAAATLHCRAVADQSARA